MICTCQFSPWHPRSVAVDARSDLARLGSVRRAFDRRGWRQHPYCATSVPKGTAWLYCKGIPTLLEVTQMACRHRGDAEAVDVPMGSVVSVAVPAPPGLVSTVETCSSTIPDTVAAIDTVAGNQQMGLLPLLIEDPAGKSSNMKSRPPQVPSVRLRLPSGYLDIKVDELC